MSAPGLLLAGRYRLESRIAAGPVLAVQPSGRVAAGSIVTVTAAAALPGHRRHHGRDHTGNDGGHGGNGQGGD
jgi:hypothetical protein